MSLFCVNDPYTATNCELFSFNFPFFPLFNDTSISSKLKPTSSIFVDLTRTSLTALTHWSISIGPQEESCDIWPLAEDPL